MTAATWSNGSELPAAVTFGGAPVEPDAEAAWAADFKRRLELVEPPGDLWADVETPQLQYRTLADIDDSPPGELLLGMFEPDGPTIAYAAPGVGKGSSMAWAIVELQRIGMKAAIYDAERRPREWARRVEGLGGDRSDVVYISPEDLGPRLASRPLWETAPWFGQIVKESGSDLLIVDSILPAVGVGEERLKSDAQAPYLYVQALDALGKPSISLGHPPKGQPESDPFGSMAWVAAARMTWLGTKAEGDGHRVRWRPRKKNERGHVAGVLLTFEYGDDGRPCAVAREDDEESTRDWLLLALKDEPRSITDLVDERLEEEEHVTADKRDRTKETLGRTLRRMQHDGSVERQGPPGGRGVRWALRWETGR